MSKSYKSKKFILFMKIAIHISKKAWERYAMSRKTIIEFSLRWVLLGGTIVQTYKSNINQSHKSKITAT